MEGRVAKVEGWHADFARDCSKGIMGYVPYVRPYVCVTWLMTLSSKKEGRLV